jgi:RNA polymerase sigma-70 factor (ECF subfamily)
LQPPSGRRHLPAELVNDWFSGEVLPLEPALMRLLRRHWRHPEDVPDLRQEIYVRVYEAVTRDGLPASAPAFVFTCARNLLVDRVRRAQVVSFDTVADLEDLPEQPQSDFTPERLADARQELALLQVALDDLSPRCREVVVLRKIDGLSNKEISKRLGIAEGTVEKQITLGVRALAETLCAQGVAAAATWMRRMHRGERDQ